MKVGGEGGIEGGDDTEGVSSINGVAASFGNRPVPGRDAGKFANVRPARIRTLRAKTVRSWTGSHTESASTFGWNPRKTPKDACLASTFDGGGNTLK